MIHRYLAVVIGFLLTVMPLASNAWRVESRCFLCNSNYYYRARDSIYFSFSGVPSNITGFDIYLAYGSRYNWEATDTLGTNADPNDLYFTYMPGDVITSSSYYFIVDSRGWETRATVGPLDVLSYTAVDPYATTTTTTTTTTYRYDYTTSSYTYRSTPTDSSYDDQRDEYMSQLHALYIGRIVGSVVGSVVGVAILIGVFFYMRRRNKRRMAAQEQQQQGELPPPPPMMMAHHDGSSGAPGTPPMTHMMAMPVPAHEQPQEPPNPGYYYAVLTPPPQSASTPYTGSDSHLSMPVPPAHEQQRGSYSPEGSNISTQPLHFDNNNQNNSSSQIPYPPQSHQ
ncbi:hypothetical protein BDA99DRAFT_525806 [Phascolomyces articulosus]|uniref:Uncharacterized protein n=1 Tax=Phascolomyces articulosus TaxID=60185 RepID=A0AAD5JP12_9FUNG|nr:hypothetical protein BDA99DRAFT_525806 [Phascolomyces articulosus]